jgi:Ion channel
LGFFAGIVGEKVVTAHNEASRSRESQASNHVKTMFNNPPSTNNNDNNLSSLHAMASTSSPQSPLQLSSILWKLIRMELPLILTVMILGIGYGVFVEGWTVIQSIYFAGITASTVGYGDFSPSSPLSRLLCVVLIPLCVVIFCNVVGHIATAYLQYQGMVQEQQFLQRQLSYMDINRMDSNHDGQVEWGEFLSFMLVALQKVDEDDISELRTVFDRLDVNKTGKLDKRDLSTAVQINNTNKKIIIDC